MSHVTCHMSCVMCQMSHVFFVFVSDKMVELVGGGPVINGAYPVYFLSIRKFLKPKIMVSGKFLI